MPWRGPEVEGEVPTLGNLVAEWIQDHCVIPDREFRGERFVLTEEQQWHLIWHYALTPEGRWVHQRGSQLVRPQKWGKGPFGAAMVCAEAAGPVVFDGWDAKGEPVGRPWATPHIQVTACSEEQTDNTWRALQPMIELGDLAADIPDTGLTRVNLPGGGLIEPVTASARSRLGQRVTFVVQDQTESWNRSNDGHKLASNQRRGLAGMNGRFLETANAPDPVEDSVASRTQAESGVYINDVDGGPGSVRNKAERRKVLRKVYGDSTLERGGWIDLDRIDAEIDALLAHDPSQAERWFLNRKIAAEGAAFDPSLIKARLKRKPWRPRAGSYIVLGIDGARFRDAIAVVATDIRSGHQWLVDVIERPEHARDDYEHDLGRIDGAVASLVEGDGYVVWRGYVDDQHIGKLMELWQNRYGEKRFVRWHTNRDKQMAYAVRGYEDALAGGDVSFDPDEGPNETFLAHLRNARKRMVTVLDERQKPMHVITKLHEYSVLKIDGASAAVVSWEARSDAIRKGVHLYDVEKQPEKPAPKGYEANFAPNVPALAGGWSQPGDME
jgi:hypothetical protein